MLYRAGLAAIVLFWAAMWGLLIRSELHPEQSGWRKVPVELVLQQLFQQGQSSDLSLFINGERAGRVHLTPRSDSAGNSRSLELSGQARVPGPDGSGAWRTSWDASLNLDGQMRISRLKATLALRAPGVNTGAGTRTEITLTPALNEGSYLLEQEGSSPVTQSFTLDRSGLESVLQHWGMDAGLVKGWITSGKQITPEITARQAQLNLHGMEVETYAVTVRGGEQTLLELHVSQLGQVLQAKTIFGWELAAE